MILELIDADGTEHRHEVPNDRSPLEILAAAILEHREVYVCDDWGAPIIAYRSMERFQDVSLEEWR